MVPTWKLNAVYMLGLACLGIVLGGWLKRKLPLLRRLNIPTPIASGMIYAVLALLLRDRVVNIDSDPVLRDLLMVAFMTTVGLSARLQLIREGGFGVVILLAIATAGAAVQNFLGIGFRGNIMEGPHRHDAAIDSWSQSDARRGTLRRARAPQALHGRVDFGDGGIAGRVQFGPFRLL